MKYGVYPFNYQKSSGKIFICRFSKMVSPSFIILRIQRLEDKQCRSGEVAHEPPHQGLYCLQIQLFLSLVLKEILKHSKQPVELHLNQKNRD